MGCLDRRYFSIHSTQTMLSTDTTTVIHKSRPILSRRSLESGLRHSSTRIADWPRGHSKSIQSTQRNAYVMRCETVVRLVWLDTPQARILPLSSNALSDVWHASASITSTNFRPPMVRESTNKFSSRLKGIVRQIDKIQSWQCSVQSDSFRWRLNYLSCGLIASNRCSSSSSSSWSWSVAFPAWNVKISQANKGSLVSCYFKMSLFSCEAHKWKSINWWRYNYVLCGSRLKPSVFRVKKMVDL